MNQTTSIPESEQLEALANGLQAFYRLVEKHIGGPIRTDFRQFATITKMQLADYLRQYPLLAQKQVMSEDESLQLHDHPVLLAEDDRWLVCWIDHGTKTSHVYFNDLPEAAAHFLMAYW